ncbi:MAG: hypothetical protein K0R08_182 [Solimicrobium sp.]|nr:hypothetical protein [Solimicrobium sp.]
MPEAGIEPARPLFTKAADFKSDVSTNFTTRALFHALLRRLLTRLHTSACLWRRGAESNRSKRLCRPLHNLFATPPWSGIVSITTVFGIKRYNKKGSPPHASLLIWSGRRVSNSRPQPWQGCALPTELLPQNTYR